MFTGIVEVLGEIVQVVENQSNIDFELTCPFTSELKIDQSLSHDGVCLTVTKIENNRYWVTAISETLLKTNLSSWKPGMKVNLERCLAANGRFDGHLVQGHVDTRGRCIKLEEDGGSWRFWFDYPSDNQNITVEKGSICVNGVSLTVVHSEANSFSVAVIPYTFENTGFHQIEVGTEVNLEFDIVGKYIRKMLQMQL